MPMRASHVLILILAVGLSPSCGGGGSGAAPAVGPAPSLAVAIAKPESGSAVPEGLPIEFVSVVADTDGTVVKVDYVQAGTVLGTATEAPFVFAWLPPRPGTYTVTAVAVDTRGNTASSMPVSITVAPTPAPPPPPTTSSAPGWVLQNRVGPKNDLYGVFFADADTGWAVGAQGTILHTANAGALWAAQPSSTTDILQRVQFVSTSRGWAVGLNGTILSTTNGGSTWTQSQRPTTANLFGLSFVSATTGWVVGHSDEGGIVLKTTDGGRSWSVRAPDPAQLYEAVSFVDERTGWIGGAGVVLSTTDGGATWRRQEMQAVSEGGTPFPIFFRDARFTSRTRGTLVGNARNGDTIATTGDGGATWTIVRRHFPPDLLNGVAFGDAEHFWAVGSGGHVERSDDGGLTWTTQATPTIETLRGVWFVDANSGWAVGNGGTILRTSNGGDGGS
jgi:photosystem II stability/assembly factor-like uncharacterized protein